MRKKTIEEELMEIHEERDDHIEKMNDEYLSSKDKHTYNFKTETDSKGSKNKTTKKSPAEIDAEVSKKSLAELDREYSSGKFDKLYNPNSEPPKQQTTTRHSNKVPLFPMILCALIFFCAGFGVSIFLGITPWIKNSSYLSVEAIVIDVDIYHDSDGDLMGTPTYEYYVNGVRYEKVSPVSSSYNICPQIGDIVTIKYNPNNPNEIGADGWLHIVLTFFGVPFMAVGVFLIIFSIKSKKKETKKSEA